MVMYWCLIALYFISFSCGYYFSSKKGPTKAREKISNNIGKLSVLVTTCYVGIAISIVNVTEILSPLGYLDGYDIGHRGQLTTFYLISIWWFIYLKSMKSTVYTNIQSKLMAAIAFIAGLNLLTLGSRLGVISGLISLFIFYGYFVKGKQLQVRVVRKLGSLKWIAIIVMVAILMFSIGLLRTGEGISLEGIIGIFAAEPIFIYASVPNYFMHSSLPLFAIPFDLFTGIVGAIPSFLFPDKADLFLEYSARNVDSYSGFGGVHHLVSLIANFGLIGFPFVAFIEGTWFGMLVRRVNANAFYRAVALTSISLLTFFMFREGLQAPIKLLFFNFLLFPFIVIRMLLLVKPLVTAKAAGKTNGTYGPKHSSDSFVVCPTGISDQTNGASLQHRGE